LALSVPHLVPPVDAIFSTAPAPRLPDPLSLHDALPIAPRPAPPVPAAALDRFLPAHCSCGSCTRFRRARSALPAHEPVWRVSGGSEEHTSELQSREKPVCRLLLGKDDGGAVRGSGQHRG